MNGTLTHNDPMINNRFNVVYHLLYSVFIRIFVKIKML